MRPADESDFAYFAQAAMEFSQQSPFRLDVADYWLTVRAMLDDPAYVIMVEPGQAHCAARLSPSLYDSSQIIAKVFSTWGRGGLKCFQAVEQECRRLGAEFLMADAWLEPRMASFYRRRGMLAADTVYFKGL